MARTRGSARRLLAGALVVVGLALVSWAAAGALDSPSGSQGVGSEPASGSVTEPRATLGLAPPTTHPAAGPATRVRVPSMGIEAPVTGIDVVGGVLTPPDDPRVLGWWDEGAEPGAARGSALVTGHTVSAGGGALDDLEDVRLGASVEVRTVDGLIRYRVARVDIYRKASLARHAEEVFSQSVPGRLVLITCEDWDGEKYLSNVVVHAHPEPSP